MFQKITASTVGTAQWLFTGLICLLILPVDAQKYDITPLVGARFGGVVELEQASRPNFEAHLADSITFGVAGGVRFDQETCEGCALIEFRWMHQNTHVGVKQDPLAPTPLGVAFRSPVTLDHFLGDFTHEWTVPDAPFIKPFLTGTLGVARMSTSTSSAAR